MKKSFFRYIIIFLSALAIYACSSVDRDAREVAKLQQEAREYNRQQKHDKARQNSQRADNNIERV